MSRGKNLLAGAVAALAVSATSVAGATGGGSPGVTVINYDSFSGDYDGAAFESKWSNPYGPGELAAGGTRDFAGGSVTLDATPFTTGVDLSVYDHIKYLAISNESFDVPRKGSVTFSARITAETPGTRPGHVVHGVYGEAFCAETPECAATARPYSAATLEGQQAGATLHMIDFNTGQLFDWFVSGSTAFALIERLPDSVIGSGNGGNRETMYTQIVKEVPITPGPHTVAIRFFRDAGKSYVEYFLDGRRVAKVGKVGVPLDVQRIAYTGIYPSMGPGEQLANQINSVVIGHGLFSLLDAFPFQHPSAPELSVSIPITQRLFGQGARASFDDFVVTIDDRG